jgi:protoheme IX farnesyltransferase
LCGTLLVASGTGTLNQCLEYRFDAQMRRTCKRPIAAGRLQPAAALWFGVALSVIGAAYLLVAVNALASLLAALTLTSYLVFYTPLKRKTPLCTFVGAVPGAMPTLIGWAAASNSISSEKAWILYAVLFLWQLPHFMAIAWMYRDDYARASYLVFPPKNDGKFMTWVTSVTSLALFVAGLAAVSASNGGIFQYSATGAAQLRRFRRASGLDQRLRRPRRAEVGTPHPAKSQLTRLWQPFSATQQRSASRRTYLLAKNTRATRDRLPSFRTSRILRTKRNL